jgi:tetratricopeptide (TPR) repeat protein
MADTERERRQWRLAAAAGLFTTLMVGVAMWPYRDQLATLSFWLMAIVMAVGGLGIFVLLVAGWQEATEAFRASLNRGDGSEKPSPAQDAAHAEQPESPLPGLTRWERLKQFAASLHQVPQPPPAFTGRQEELDELATAIRERNVVISGPVGVGKTALALRLADQLAHDYPDGQVFVDLQETPSPVPPARAIGRVIHALYPDQRLPASAAERAQLYRWLLHDKRMLVLIDGAEDVEQVQALVPPASCRLLITSRQRLPLPRMHTLDAGPLSEEEARRLLHDITPDVGSEGTEAIAELCGHLPLALKLSASALADSSLAWNGFADLLWQRCQRLDPVNASLSVSYDLLDAELQRLWARLGVFSIPFDLGAATAVCDLTPDTTLEGLDQLVGRGMVAWRETTERYRLRDLARAMAYHKLQEIEDIRPVHRRAASYIEEELKAKRFLTPAEMMEAVDQWERGEAWKRFADATNELIKDLYARGYFEEIETRLERALTAVREHLDAPELESSVLHSLGITLMGQEERERAIDIYQQSIEISEGAGDLKSKAMTRANLAGIYLAREDHDRAIEVYRQAIETLEREEERTHRVMQIHLSPGTAYASKGDLDRAMEIYHESIEFLENQGDLYGLARAWGSLADLYERQEAWDRAIACYQEIREASERVGDIYRVIQMWNRLGHAYAHKGSWDEAVEALQRLLTGRTWLREAHGIAETHRTLGLVRTEQKAWEEALVHYQQGLEVYERMNHDLGKATTWANMGKACVLQEDWDRAIEHYERSLETFEGLHDLQGQARALDALGLAHARKGAEIEQSRSCSELWTSWNGWETSRARLSCGPIWAFGICG